MSFAVRSAFVLAVVAAFSTSPVEAAEGVPLKWKFSPGQSSHYVSSQDVKINSKGGGFTQEMVMKQTSDIHWMVESLDDDGNAHITQTIERIRVETGAADDALKFDSNDDKAPEGADEMSIEALRIGVNQPVNLVLNPHGKVVDVRLSDQFAQKLKESSQYGPLSAMFSRDNLKQMASMSTLELPADPVTKGETWQQESTLSDPVAGKQKLTTTYRYDGSEEHDGRHLDKIAATATISTGDGNKAVPLTIKDQKLNGVFWFDRKAGRIDEMEMTIKVVRELPAGANKLEQTLVTKLHTHLSDEPATKPKKSEVKKNAAEDL